MTVKQRKMLRRIAVAAVLLLAVSFVPATGWIKFILFLLPYMAVGFPVLKKAARNIRNGQIFDENFLMAIATVGAFAVGEYHEGVAVMLFYQIGELFENYAVGKTRKSIADLMDIRPDTANVEREGVVETVDPDEVAVGEIIVVYPGERISIDGEVIEGRSNLDTSALTGESAPREAAVGDKVISGSINLNGVLRIRTEKEFAESTVSKILELVENASERKAKSEAFITRFARYYTPVVCISALLLAIVPPLFLGEWAVWFQRALIFLVVSCPCALVISVPLSFFGGIGAASACGILVKGSNFMEALSSVDTVVFDKTGTLTEGRFIVKGIEPVGMTGSALLEVAALAEAHSNHPISRSVREAWGREIQLSRITDVEEKSGFGISAVVDGKRVLAGSSRLMEEEGITVLANSEGTVVHIAVDGIYAGCIHIADKIKDDAKSTVENLRKTGVRRVAMLTGDSEAVGRSVGSELGIDEVLAELLPGDKVEKVERLIGEMLEGGKLVFVGDGINDAPVISRADVGIAMGALGSDAAIEAADVVLMNDKPSSIVTAIRISRKTLRIVRQNIAFAIGVKILVMILGAAGIANMWAAVFADVGVSVIAIMNAMRILGYRAE